MIIVIHCIALVGSGFFLAELAINQRLALIPDRSLLSRQKTPVFSFSCSPAPKIVKTLSNDSLLIYLWHKTGKIAGIRNEPGYTAMSFRTSKDAGDVPSLAEIRFKRIKMMKTIQFYAIFAILILGQLPLEGWSKPGKKSGSDSFNVMSYNIRMNTAADGVNAWPLRKEKVTGLIRFHGADLFGVQEALPEQVLDMEKQFPDFGHVGIGRDDGKSQGEHMCIFYRKSRFEKLANGNFWLSPTPEKPGRGWDAACNRTCTWIKLKDKTTGKVFYHFNTHLDHIGKVARLEGTRLILTKIAEINRHGLPLILTGDFNATAQSEPVKEVLKVLTDARNVSDAPPYGPDGSCGGFEVGEQDRIIDYIFINEKIRVIRYGILPDTFGLFYPSDHLPVFAEVRLL